MLGQDFFVGPACYEMPAKQVQHMLDQAVEQTSQGCCQDGPASTTSTTTVALVTSMWDGFWWVRVGLFMGFLLAMFCIIGGSCVYRAISGSNFRTSTPAQPSPLAIHGAVAVDVRKALAHEQIRLVQGRLAAPNSLS